MDFVIKHRGIAVTCKIDEIDAPLLTGNRWYLCNGYLRRDHHEADGRKWREYMHRTIAQAGMLHVDHINTCKVDNRRQNLRIVTRSQNLQNRRGADAKSKTGIRGVFFDKSRGQFVATVHVAGKTVLRKRFDSLQAAQHAAQKARQDFMTHSAECLLQTQRN